MKSKKTYTFIAFSAIALTILLIIQVNWLIQTAKVKEELFNEKATMVLSRTAQELCADKEICKNMRICCSEKETSECALKLAQTETNKIDSLLKHYMNFYSFHIDYSFEIIHPESTVTKQEINSWSNNIFKKRLEEVANINGLELKLIFPEKKKFIIEEMGGLFIASILLILVVFVLFLQTIRSLIREKKISEHTSEFLNNMTHEFKTPLTNIGLAGKMIFKESNIKHDDKIKHYSGIIIEENEKLRLQVEQVLSMTALERGEIPLTKADLDFHQLINSVLKCMSIQIENKQGELQLNLMANYYVLFGDKSHLTNAICNLVDNAIKYSHDKPQIKIETSNNNQSLILKISDNGIGIEKEYQKMVFNKFFRVPTGDLHDVKGFGLGLAYLKKIIELHGGTIELQSEKGKGTIFTITFPIING